MKKSFFCIFLAVLLCLALCACGGVKNSTDRGDGETEILPDVSPMISPDVKDGVVTDQDGVIGNGHNADGSGQTGTNTSPSPDAGMGPGAGQTGTTPSASPKP